MFVVLEGIDGSGKTSVSAAVAGSLRSSGYSVYVTKEPTELIRPMLADDVSPRDPFTLFLLFTADRQHHQHELKVALEENDIVICDRYMLSSFAYQGTLIAEAIDSWDEAYKWMNDVSRFIHVIPDLTIYLDLDPATSVRRIAEKRGELHTYFEKEGYLQSVRKAYQNLLEFDTVPVDSSRSIDEVTEDVFTIIMNRINKPA